MKEKETIRSLDNSAIHLINGIIKQILKNASERESISNRNMKEKQIVEDKLRRILFLSEENFDTNATLINYIEEVAKYINFNNNNVDASEYIKNTYSDAILINSNNSDDRNYKDSIKRICDLIEIYIDVIFGYSVKDDFNIKSFQVLYLKSIKEISHIIETSPQFEYHNDGTLYDRLAEFILLDSFNNTLNLTINDHLTRLIKEFHNIHFDENILYIHYEEKTIFSNIKKSFTITEKAIYYKIDGGFWGESNSKMLSWEDITSIEYNEGKVYFIENNNRLDPFNISINEILAYNFIGIEFNESLNAFVYAFKPKNNLGIAFIESLNAFVYDSNPKRKLQTITNDFLSKLDDLIDKEEYEQAIISTDSFFNEYRYDEIDDVAYAIYYLKSLAHLRSQTRLNDGLNAINRAIELNSECDDSESDCNSIKASCNSIKASISFELGDYSTARDSIIQSLNTDNKEDRRHFFNDFITYDTIYRKNFLNKNYNERKLIIPLKQIDGCITETNRVTVFLEGSLPEIEFPTGHPLTNTLYVGHPFNKSLYFPYDNYEEILFLDKVDEFFYLLQCLGAKEISMTSIKGKKIDKISNSYNKKGGEFGNRAIDLKLERELNKSSTQEHHSKSEMAFIQHFSPKYKPYIPSDLIWYTKESRWQRLVQRRMQGSQLSIQETLSSNDVSFVNSKEQVDIEAEITYFLLKAKGNSSSASTISSKSAEETIWQFSVIFAPTEILEEEYSISKPNNSQLKQQLKLENTQIEQKTNYAIYKDEVLFCIEDGNDISKYERRFLERKRVELGLSSEEATRIENDALNSVNYTQEELEYITELKEVLEDDEIPDKIKRLLNRFRESLNISEERSLELERSVLEKKTRIV